MAALAALALIGLVAAILLPANTEQQPSPSLEPTTTDGLNTAAKPA